MHYWEPVAAEALDRFHAAACRLLEEMGIRIRHPGAIDRLVAAGAKQADAATVRLPRAMVECAIASAPDTFRIYDRRGGSAVIGDASHHHLNGGTMTEMLDYPSGTRRPATLQDVRQLHHLVDALDAIDLAVPMVEGRDAPAGQGEILTCAEMLKHTTKFCFACPVEARATQAFIDMAKAVAGTPDLSGKPIVGLLATIVPGYEIDQEGAEVMMMAGREGLPIVLMGGSIAGMQAPATMAGSLLMKVTEELAALCLVQAVRPGSPCLMDFSHVKLDMRTMEIEEAGPDFALGMAVGAQLGRRYGIPSYVCPSSDSKACDFQAGHEMSHLLLAALLCGTHVSVNAGTASKCSAGSYELLVLHNEMLRGLLRIRRGMTIDDDTLAADVQLEVGLRGDYLGHPHTLRHIRSPDEFLHKDLFDATGIRAPYEDPCGRAQARWRQLLRDHQPAVSAADKRAIDAVVKRHLESH